MAVACVAGGIVWVRVESFGGGAVFQKKGVGTRSRSRDEGSRDEPSHIFPNLGSRWQTEKDLPYLFD